MLGDNPTTTSPTALEYSQMLLTLENLSVQIGRQAMSA
jgi:hypothetical protein